MIKDNIFKIKERIASACFDIDKNPLDISIIAVTKGRGIEQIREVCEAGLTEIGENKVQEALLKYNELSTIPAKNLGGSAAYCGGNYRPAAIKWHMVGHLQTNKAKDAVNIFDLIQSVDSLRLASEINRQAAKINKVQDILIEVNVSGESAKFGLKPGDVIDNIKAIAQLKNINIQGLMTIASIADNQEKNRPYFKKLRELFHRINALRVTRYALRILSMGMTDDFEIAIEEGANMVRLGRAIFSRQ